ncbi:MAG: AAA family ATPase [Planctomycetaceae bacterium]|nr:AAA family ATPase [Planctomycetaceae bacterium]
MWLRYLHLPDYGVLKDVKVAFHQEGILERKGSLQFVVGLNGTGKSSLLRAVYETFRCLDRGEVPPFPVALAYETTRDKERKLVFFRHLEDSKSEAVFVVAPFESHLAEVVSGLGGETTWDDVMPLIKQGRAPSGEVDAMWIHGDAFQGNQLLAEHLPDPLVAYTSGDLAVWLRAAEKQLPGDALAEIIIEGGQDDDRPRGWDINRELGAVDVEMTAQQRNELRAQIEPHDSDADASCLLLTPPDLKLAAVAVGLVAASEELRQHPAEDVMQAWRSKLLERMRQQQHGKRPAEKDARTLLNEVDWWWPTHLSITYRPHTGRMNPEWHAQWLALCALADEVIRLPLGRMQMVIDLGFGERRITPMLEGVLGTRFEVRGEETVDRWPPTIGDVANQVDGAQSGACAVARILSTVRQEQGGTATPLWQVFRTLQGWRAARLIEDATVTVKRVSPMTDHAGYADDVVLTWDDFSDGEQMLLGRMALLLLLRGRDGSMLLLDEPETHFNDSWKREIIDIVDDNVLKTTVAQVLVATHTSIALTDAFASEIIRLVREDGQARVKPVSFPTFGAEPGRVMLHVFETAECIGSRADEVLRQKLAEDWTADTRDALERLVAKIGGGWPRARLQKLLDELTHDTPGP